jgi:YhcH/YjgK/YiaL family protein
MILDTLNQAFLYEGFHPSFPKAFAWLRSFDLKTPDGRYEIKGSALVAIVQRYETASAEAKKWEAHRLHGDIQYLVSGCEYIGYADRETLTVRLPYHEENDMECYQPASSTTTRLMLSTGSFAIFLPSDAHQPGVMIESPSPVLKVVIKFRLMNNLDARIKGFTSDALSRSR